MKREAKSLVIRLRVSPSEMELLQRVALAENRPAGNYVRWAAVEAAKEAEARLEEAEERRRVHG